MDRDDVMSFGWLAKYGISSENELDDGDFAWLSHKYQAASPKEREGMNKREHRKIPYKVHGSVKRDGWKAAWQATLRAVSPGRGQKRVPSFDGGPSAKQVLAKLRRDKPSGIVIKPDNTIVDVQTKTGKKRTEDEDTDTALVLELSGYPLTVLHEEGREPGEGRAAPFRVGGVALVDYVVAQNRSYFDKEFNDLCMEYTNAYMSRGGVVTVFARHGQADGGFFLPGTGLPVGRVDAPLYREGALIRYEALISETPLGKEVRTLIDDKVLADTSVRIYGYKYELVKLTEEEDEPEVARLTEGFIGGVDFAPTGAGIGGAGIDILFERAPATVPITIADEEEESMEINWSEITLEELRANVPALLEEAAKPLKEGVARLTEVVTALTARYEDPAVFGEGQTALGRIEGLTEELEGSKLDLTIARASLQPLGAQVYEGLKERVTVAGDLTGELVGEVTEAVRAEFLAQLTSGELGPGVAKGKADVGAEGRDRSLTPEQQQYRQTVARYSRTK